MFDVTMAGSFDGAETCELVRLFLLNKIIGFIPIEKVGLYRDEGLIILENPDGPSTERIRKTLHAVFQACRGPQNHDREPIPKDLGAERL